LSLALLLGAVNAACVNPRPAPEPLSPAVAGDAPAQVWTTRAGRRLTGRVAVNDGTIYGAGVDRKVYAIDLTTGQIQWGSRLSGLLASGVLVSGDAVYAGSSRPDGRVYALDRATGRRIWRTATGPVGAPLALTAGVLIAATQRGDVIGLDPKTGAVRWRRRLGVSRVAPVPVGDSALFVATVDSLFRVTAAGVVTHRAASPGTIVSPSIPFQGSLVAGTTDSLIVALAPDDLREEWRIRVDAPVLGSPAASGDTLFAVSRRGTLYRIVTDSPPEVERIVELEWPVTAPVTVLHGEILLGGADGAIRALRPDGSEVWRIQVARQVELGPLPLDDGMVIIGGDGDLHRYRQ